MRKIFFFDIDNTLLDHHSGTIPQSAKDAIERLKQAGHIFAIATGRSYSHALPYIESLQPAYCVTQNGARVYKGAEVAHQTPLDKANLSRLFQTLAAVNLNYGGIDGNNGRSCVSADADVVREPMASVNIPFYVNRDFHCHESVFQAWLFIDEATEHTLMPELKTNFHCFDYVRWHSMAVDVIPKGINKLTGCQWVLTDTGLDIEHSIAFGDGLNDIEMLQGVGMGIAMGNAHPDLLAKASRIAPAIHQDGVAIMVDALLAEFKS